MNFRTDLAVEAAEIHKNIDGLEVSEKRYGESVVVQMCIKSAEAAQKIGKPQGTYITITVPPLTDYFQSGDERIKILASQIGKLIPEKGLILVAGLGNTDITPDALGPKAADNVLATRHISEELTKSIGIDNFRPVSVLKPGVLGKTGIDVSETLSGAIKRIKPVCSIIIDALASRKLSRLGRTIQLSNSGISPGAGVGNARPLLDEQTLGIPVISIGVPTVVDALTLANDIVQGLHSEDREAGEQNEIGTEGKQMIVTPKEIDLLITRAAFLIGMAINQALQPHFSPEEIQGLMS